MSALPDIAPVYHSNDGEIAEDTLLVPGESITDDGDSEDDTVPIRLLSAFTVYHSSTNELVGLDTLLDLEDEDDSQVCASGLVTAYLSPDEASDDSDTLAGEELEPVGPVHLSKILELSVHSIPDGDSPSKTLDRCVLN